MLHLETHGKTLLVTPSVEIDAHSAERLRSQIDPAFEKSPCLNIIFDFSKVHFMDSSGIGLLIGRYKQTEKRGGRVLLANMCAEMERLYSISGLAKIVWSYPSLDSALEALKGGTQ